MLPEHMRRNENNRHTNMYGQNRMFEINSPEWTLQQNPEDVKVLVESHDPEADYSFNSWYLLELNGIYYLTNESGCSCPSPSETWGVEYVTNRELLWVPLTNIAAAYYVNSGFKQFVNDLNAAGYTTGLPSYKFNEELERFVDDDV